MTFHWYPHILPAKNGVGGVSFIALATRSRIEVVAVTVPVHRNKFVLISYLLVYLLSLSLREPERQVVWQGEVEGNGWPCRLRWSHTHFSNGSRLILTPLSLGSDPRPLVQRFIWQWAAMQGNLLFSPGKCQLNGVVVGGRSLITR